jgi:hypothetical protein
MLVRLKENASEKHNKGGKKMTTYTEKRGITTKTEFTEFDAIGWSCIDGSTIYRATVTEFSIARGLISVRTKVVNADGSDYKPTHYRNHWNGFTPTVDEIRLLYELRQKSL